MKYNVNFLLKLFNCRINRTCVRIFRNYDFNVAHQPARKLKDELCRLKDRRRVGEKAGVVYKLGCMDCNACYVGETGRQVDDRMTEHQRDITNQKATSKVFQHVNKTGHNRS